MASWVAVSKDWDALKSELREYFLMTDEILQVVGMRDFGECPGVRGWKQSQSVQESLAPLQMVGSWGSPNPKIGFRSLKHVTNPERGVSVFEPISEISTRTPYAHCIFAL